MSAELVKERWRKAETALADARRDYWINYSFYQGDQWIIWNPQTRTVAEFPRDRDDDRARMTVNRIQPNLINLMAKFQQRELGFESRASKADDATIAGARLGEHILDAEQHAQGWNRVRAQEMLNTFLGGTGFVLVEWDPTSGEELSYDPTTGQVIGTGDVRVSSHSIAAVALEPGTDDWRDARWGIVAAQMPPAQAKERYGLKTEPDADSEVGTGPQARRWGLRGQDKDVKLCTVYTMYEKPSRQDPKGKHLVVIGDDPVIDRPWPMPWKDRLNIIPFVQTPLSGTYLGHTFVTDAIPLQASYNHFESIMHEHLKQTAIARMLMPSSAQVSADDLSDRPGEVIEYDDAAQHQPAWMIPPQLGRWIVEHGAGLRDAIDDLMNVHDISRGEAPGDRNSGLALTVLAEKDQTPMAVMSEDQAAGWSEVGSMVLKLYEAKAIEERTAVVLADGVPIERKWTGLQLRGQTDVRVPIESVTPHSKASMQAWVLDLLTKAPAATGGLGLGQIANLLELPNTDALKEFVNADVVDAQRENALMAAGEVPWVGDMTSGRPRPMLFEAHDVHIAEHNRARKSPTYWYATDPDVRAIFDAHIKAHEMLALQQAMEQRDANQIQPGAGAIPQGDEPPGSQVPPDYAERPPQAA